MQIDRVISFSQQEVVDYHVMIMPLYGGHACSQETQKKSHLP